MLTALKVSELADTLGSRARAIETLHWLYSQPPTMTELPDSIPGVSWKSWAKVKERFGLPQLSVVEHSPEASAPATEDDPL